MNFRTLPTLKMSGGIIVSTHVHSIDCLEGGYFLLKLIPTQQFEYQAGQHVKINFRDERGDFQRLFSIACAPGFDTHLDFFIRPLEDRLISALKNLSDGTPLELEGPLGGFRIQDPSKPIVFIAGGTGIAPIRSFFAELTANFQRPPIAPLSLVFGCRTPNSFPSLNDFLSYDARGYENVRVCLVAEAEVPGYQHIRKGLVTSYIMQHLNPDAHYYLCGPNPMIETARALLYQGNISDRQIFFENHG